MYPDKKLSKNPIFHEPVGTMILLTDVQEISIRIRTEILNFKLGGERIIRLHTPKRRVFRCSRRDAPRRSDAGYSHIT